MKQSIQELVRKDILHREQVGIETYGTPLYAYNGRSAILDAYEEALDLCMYLRQVIEEMTIGGFDLKTTHNPDPILEPHHRAARSLAENELSAEQLDALPVMPRPCFRKEPHELHLSLIDDSATQPSTQLAWCPGRPTTSEQETER